MLHAVNVLNLLHLSNNIKNAYQLLGLIVQSEWNNAMQVSE